MVLDTVAFSLAVILLAVIIVMLVVGLAELPAPPTSTRCRLCSTWMLDTHHRAEAMCLRCRVNAAFHLIVQRRG